MDHLRAKYANQFKDFRDLQGLRQEDENLSFEKLFLPYDFVNSKENYQKLSHTDADEILEKYALLYYLISDSPFMYLGSGVDYFEHTIYKDTIHKKYKTSKEILKRMDELRQQYETKFNDLHNLEIQRVLHTRNSPNKENAFSNKLLDMKSKFLSEKRPVKFLQNVIQENSQYDLMLSIIFQYIHKRLKEKMIKEEVNIVQLIHYKRFLKGETDEESLEVIKSLFVEANARFAFFKLSDEFKSNKHFVVKDLMQSVLKLPKELKNKRISPLDLITDKDYDYKNIKELNSDLDMLVDKHGKNKDNFKDYEMISAAYEGREIEEDGEQSDFMKSLIAQKLLKETMPMMDENTQSLVGNENLKEQFNNMVKLIKDNKIGDMQEEEDKWDPARNEQYLNEVMSMLKKGKK